MDIIVGGGKYGCHAVEFLKRKSRSFVVVDTNPDCLAMQRFGLKPTSNLLSEGEYFLHGDLARVVGLIEELKPEYLFPTAPVHIAADMAQVKFKLTPWIDAINCILPSLPQTVVLHAGMGKIIVSFNRDNHCADYCSMPETCPTSKIKKPCTMTKLMKFACPGAFILISHSMTPGMGALKGTELSEFFSWAKNQKEFVVGTSCDCHGVYSAFKNT
jgi:hypothetical protein